MKETTKDFRDNSIKTHNDFVRLLQDNLKKVNTEEIQAELRQEIRGLPYIFAIGLFIGLYEWIRARLHD
ncbi:MAG: hypothetical protein E6830_04225 [Staphylococcus epidermidis]|nr:hypothetical protein [Staphylococcus epidermidis]